MVGGRVEEGRGGGGAWEQVGGAGEVCEGRVPALKRIGSGSGDGIRIRGGSGSRQSHWFFMLQCAINKTVSNSTSISISNSKKT